MRILHGKVKLLPRNLGIMSRPNHIPLATLSNQVIRQQEIRNSLLYLVRMATIGADQRSLAYMCFQEQSVQILKKLLVRLQLLLCRCRRR